MVTSSERLSGFWNGTDRNLLAERLGINVDYADWLLNHARKMKSGIIRVVVSEKNDGRETASVQAHHYRYVLDDNLTPDTRHYVQAVIERFRTISPDILTRPGYREWSFSVLVEPLHAVAPVTII